MTKKAKIRVCNKCGWAHAAVARKDVEKKGREIGMHIVKLYEHCFQCGNIYTDFHDETMADKARIPAGCTMQGILVDAERRVSRPCPDCAVKPGEQHKDGCDVERCPDCGGQMISCGCDGDIEMPRLPWAGEWPGVMECREFGWYSKLVPGRGRVSCDKDEDGASEDLNRLARDAVWSKEHGRFILPAND